MDYTSLFKVSQRSTPLPLSDITVLNIGKIQTDHVLEWAALFNAIGMLSSVRLSDRVGRKHVRIHHGVPEDS